MDANADNAACGLHSLIAATTMPRLLAPMRCAAAFAHRSFCTLPAAAAAAHVHRYSSHVSASFLSSPSFLLRRFAVTTAFERRDNTSELLDFAAGRRDMEKWRKQLLYRSRQRGE